MRVRRVNEGHLGTIWGPVWEGYLEVILGPILDPFWTISETHLRNLIKLLKLPSFGRG